MVCNGRIAKGLALSKISGLGIYTLIPDS